jgi:hypothetical protein
MRRRPLFLFNLCAYAISLSVIPGWIIQTILHLKKPSWPPGKLYEGPWTLAGNVEGWEVKRITSPDNPYSPYRFDAVMVEFVGGATTTPSYRIYIVPKGEKPRFGEDDPSPYQLDADHEKGLDFRWENPRRLEIRYEEARIYDFSNSWHDWRDEKKWGYVIETQLRPLKKPWSLSAGDRNMPK